MYSRDQYFNRFFFVSQENVKYLPGIKLGKNVVADPDLEHAGIYYPFSLIVVVVVVAGVFIFI